MKKSKKARTIGRVGRNPVIAVRVTPALHQRITESAKASGRSMSEEMAALLTRGFEWQEAFSDRVKMLEQAKVEINRMVADNFKAEMRRRGWKPLHGTANWIDPEATATLQSGFVDPAEAEPDEEFDTLEEAIEAIKERLNRVEAMARRQKG